MTDLKDCIHGRPDGALCPHCLGVNELPVCTECGGLHVAFAPGCEASTPLDAMEAERDSLRAQLAEAQKALGPMGEDGLYELESRALASDSLRAQLAERDATIAVMVKVLEHVAVVVPYVTATISPGNTFPTKRDEWVEVHAGRAASSCRQLEGLRKRSDQALSSDAGKRHAERVAALERVVGAARLLRAAGPSDVDGSIMEAINALEAFDAAIRALDALDAKERP